ncbi:MAG TPA: hypothetical protein VLJ13_03180 [Brevundimonas sp.]|nr:hypothetical protein [Brevundimonas sp.]
MSAIKTLSVAAAALALSAGASLAQTPYGSQQQQEPNRQQEAIGAILGALFGDRLGVSTSIDAQWAAGRTPLFTQRAQFETRVDAEVRSGAVSASTGARLKADYYALVQLEQRYGADRRFTTQERAELSQRYTALTDVLTQGGYAGGQWDSLLDGRAEFEARVDAQVRARRLTRTEGTRLKADYARLVTVEAGYTRDGSLSAREREDLEAQLDALDARVGDTGYGGNQPVVDLRTRLMNIERAAASPGIGRPQAEQIRVEVGDLMRLEAAYARINPSADDQAYLERRIADLELRARVDRR